MPTSHIRTRNKAIIYGILFVPGGGLSLDGNRKISSRPNYFLPVEALSRLFRRRCLEHRRLQGRAPCQPASHDRPQGGGYAG
jgi:hypothetical protein